MVRACVTNDKNLTMEHALRKPVESRCVYKQRRRAIAFGMIVALTLAAAMEVGKAYFFLFRVRAERARVYSSIVSGFALL
jgi:hypothetical protein